MNKEKEQLLNDELKDETTNVTKTKKEQEKLTDSPKAQAPFSIDDRNVGCPLVYGKSRRPYVNWYKIVEIFEPVIKMFAK